MQEKHETVFENQSVTVKTIKSLGYKSGEDEWYDQPEAEIAFVTKGRAVLQLAEGKITLNAGESYFFKAHERHRIDFTSEDCEWLCVYIKNV